jgi:hypothetical protein
MVLASSVDIVGIASDPPLGQIASATHSLTMAATVLNVTG